MEQFGCTTPFGLNLNNICTDNATGKKALELFWKLSDKRYFIEECRYPCKSVKLSMISLRGGLIFESIFNFVPSCKLLSLTSEPFIWESYEKIRHLPEQ